MFRKQVEIGGFGHDGALADLHGLIAKGSAQRREGPVIIELGLVTVMLGLVTAAGVPLEFPDNRVVGVAQRRAVILDERIIIVNQALVERPGAAERGNIQCSPDMP